jgi:hypothetical protein
MKGPMIDEALMLLILVLSPLAVLLLHAVLARVRRAAPPQKTAFHAALAGAVPVFALLWGAVFRSCPPGSGCATAAVYCLVVYGALAYTYFHFFNMSETARRIRILCVIETAGSVSPGELTALYKTTDVVTIRLGRLVALHQLHEEGGYYSVRGRTLYWAGRAILLWRRILGLEPEPGGER